MSARNSFFGVSLRACLAAVAIAVLAGCGGRTPGTSVETTPADGDARQAAEAAAPWRDALAERIRQIDEDMPGNFGVYVKDLASGAVVEHHADRPWYLASTVKVPVAMAVLAEVEAGRLTLEQEVELRETDYVDGAGDLVWQEPGASFSVATLIGKSIENSDSTATDMLIRLVGERRLARYLDDWTDGFDTLTTILQVRYDAYGQLHPAVKDLDNRQIVSLRQADAGESRLQALARLLDVERGDLRMDSMEEAFERYYATGKNSATLEGFGVLLERLVAGELLNEAHTRRLLDHMRRITTGDRRISAGLGSGVEFAQKTGTQAARACNVGIVHAKENARLLVAACAEKFDELAQAEQAFRALGQALVETVLSAGAAAGDAVQESPASNP